MISRLIEAKPDELRVYIEEAAGISKYKERRRDTESRIQRTMENLERLTDIRDELGRQLGRLERQAKAAEKYADYKKQERQLTVELLALRWRGYDQSGLEQKQITASWNWLMRRLLNAVAVIRPSRNCVRNSLKSVIPITKFKLIFIRLAVK